MNTIDKSKFTLNIFSDELTYSVNIVLNDLKTWQTKLHQCKHLSASEFTYIALQSDLLVKDLDQILKLIDYWKAEIRLVDSNVALEKVIGIKKELYSRFRMSLSFYSALLTSLNWQSPSINSSKNTRVGLERSEIKSDWNDYKRDRSEDTFYKEKLLKKELFINKSETHLNIFNSGMGAFTSILYFLINENIIDRGVLASSQIYVESRMLIKEFFKNNLETFDTNDSESIVELIRNKEPNVVFIEPISNTNNLRLFDIRSIIRSLSKNYEKDIYIIVDVTCAMGFENIFDDLEIPTNIKIIIHGSILKAIQLGLERVNAGFVQSFGSKSLSDKILDYRTLSGTNIQDFASYLIPVTTKELLQNRMQVIEKNAITLANELSQIDPFKEIIEEVVYPKIESHADFSISNKLKFAGSFFNIKFINQLNSDKYFEIFTKKVISIARKDNVDIVHGASFGFNQTSIYYSVGWDEPENHYIRISPGTETDYEVQKIKMILLEAYTEFKNEILLTYK